jgi:hypothetical protein
MTGALCEAHLVSDLKNLGSSQFVETPSTHPKLSRSFGQGYPVAHIAPAREHGPLAIDGLKVGFGPVPSFTTIQPAPFPCGFSLVREEGASSATPMV